jgi:hypothetical protein
VSICLRQSTQSILIHILDQETANNFDMWSTLPPEYQLASRNVMVFSGRYLRDKNFEWSSFKQAINDLSTAQLTFDLEQEDNIVQNDRTVGTMLDRISAFLKTVLHASVDEASLKQKLESCINGLEKHSQNGFLQFSKSQDEKNTSWEYRVAFAVPTPGAQDAFAALVTTILITADFHDESSWWGLSSSHTANFGADIHAMRLVVGKDFVAPKLTVCGFLNTSHTSKGPISDILFCF